MKDKKQAASKRAPRNSEPTNFRRALNISTISSTDQQPVSAEQSSLDVQNEYSDRNSAFISGAVTSGSAGQGTLPSAVRRNGYSGVRRQSSRGPDHHSGVESTRKFDVQPDYSSEQSPSGPYNVLIALRSFRHLMTVDEVAELLTNSTCTVYRMVRQNEIPHVMIGGSLRFDPSALEAWLAKKDPELARAARQLEHAA